MVRDPLIELPVSALGKDYTKFLYREAMRRQLTVRRSASESRLEVCDRLM